jgi:hypothetical protein
MGKLLREPLLHFAVLGFALFLGYHGLSSRGFGGDRIVITEGRIEQLAAGFNAIHQRMPTSLELDGMIEESVREEVYSREAVSMGLDRDDTIIRRRLMTKLQFLSEDTTPIAEPTEAQLQAYLDAHAADFRVETRYSLTHIYLNPQRHGERLDADVQRLLAQLRRDGPAAASQLGDPFLLDLELDDAAAGELARQFGGDFEIALRTLPIGEWSGPVSSSFGTHVVLIRKRNAERTAVLADVRDDVRRKWIQDQRERANDRFYSDLRKRYAVTVERPASIGGDASMAPATASR